MQARVSAHIRLAGGRALPAVAGVRPTSDPARVSPLVMFLASDESALLDRVVLPAGA